MCVKFSVPQRENLCVFHLGEKLFQTANKHVRLLLDELLASRLQVSIHVFLRVDVMLFNLRRSLR